MNKEVLEALERLAMPDELHIKECEKLGISLTEDYEVVKQALLELKSIKEANPSEALEAFGRITLHTEYDNDSHYDGLHFEDDCKLVDKALEFLEAIENANPSEALECLESYINNIIFAKDLTSQKKQLLANIATIKHSLQRLESVDNSKPSAALKALKVLDETISPLLEPVLAEYEDDLSDKITSNYFALKQALLNAEQEHKALEIIKEKNVSVCGFRNRVFGYQKKQNGNITINDTYEYYLNNFGLYHNGFDSELLTKKEFNLLKEVLE